MHFLLFPRSSTCRKTQSQMTAKESTMNLIILEWKNSTTPCAIIRGKENQTNQYNNEPAHNTGCNNNNNPPRPSQKTKPMQKAEPAGER